VVVIVGVLVAVGSASPARVAVVRKRISRYAIYRDGSWVQI